MKSDIILKRKCNKNFKNVSVNTLHYKEVHNKIFTLANFICGLLDKSLKLQRNKYLS